jgi:predicted transcriptional regulator
MAEEQTSSVDVAAELTIAWLSNPNTRVNAEDIGGVLRQVHQAVKELEQPAQEPETSASQEFTPAVSVRKSLASKDHIISMIDGKPYKSLKRHLSTHGLTPQQYRERYGLKPDYPMVAESYSEKRRDLAKQIGLGRKAKQTTVTSAGEAKPARGRRKKPADDASG